MGSAVDIPVHVAAHIDGFIFLEHAQRLDFCKLFLIFTNIFFVYRSDTKLEAVFFSSPELAQGELLGYCDVRRPSYVWTSKTYETSVRQLFSLCTL